MSRINETQREKDLWERKKKKKRSDVNIFDPGTVLES